MTSALQLDLAAVNVRQQAIWASYDFTGPTVKALEAIGSGRIGLEQGMEERARALNHLDQPGPIVVPARYLESIGVVRR